jgi:hypothetical protein
LFIVISKMPGFHISGALSSKLMRSQLEETYLAIGENQFTLSCPLPAGQPRKHLLKIYCERCRLSIFHMKWTFNIASSLFAGDILITSAGCSKSRIYANRGLYVLVRSEAADVRCRVPVEWDDPGTWASGGEFLRSTFAKTCDHF